jgi:oligo-1,6-glucosidase/alpha-glucosidase
MAPFDVPWWKRTTVYQIYPRSFADSNGDGIGDLQGIVDRLDYLHALGVETLWISPFFASPQADFGYDVSDHLGVAPEYGGLEDVRRLVDETHARGMKIVFDLVLNHTSDHHPWFLESRRAKESEKRSFYLWREGRKPGGRAPPNNWKSMLGGSGWHYDEPSGEWYWASFLPFQPDLNYRNPEVKQAMLGVVRHWLTQGVDGFRLDIFNAIYKDASFDDNPFSIRPVPSEHNPHGFFQHHRHTLDHPDTLAFARELRAVCEEFGDPPRFLVGEVFGDAETLRRYCGEDADGLNLVFLFQTMRTPFTAPAMRALIEELERAFPEPFTPTYVFGNHDRPRFIHRLGEHRDKAKLLATMQLTVRGVPFIYYGEEIGMRHREIPLCEGRDPVAARFRFVPQWLARRLQRFGILLNRDECRLPMQWHHGPNAGFAPSHAEPWLPVHPDVAEINVAAQERDPESLLNCYRRLLSLRRESRALSAGRLELHDAARLPRDVVAYRRVHGEGTAEQAVDVYLNFGRRPVVLDLRGKEGRVLVSNRRGEARAAAPEHELGPYEGVLVLDRLAGP